MGMRVDIVTLFPEMCQQVLDASIIGRAARRGCIETHCHQIRDYTLNKQKQTDDYPYGGGCGMVLYAQPIADCLRAVQKEVAEQGRPAPHIVFLTAGGQRYTEEPLRTKRSPSATISSLAASWPASWWPTACSASSPAFWPSRRATRRRATGTACWNIPSIPAPRSGRAVPCPTSCWAATTRRSTHGGAKRAGSAPVCAARSCMNSGVRPTPSPSCPSGNGAKTSASSGQRNSIRRRRSSFARDAAPSAPGTGRQSIVRVCVDHKTGRIEHLFVAADARGKGIGQKMLDFARKKLEEHEHPTLTVLDQNTRAIALYRRMGWKLTGEAAQVFDPAEDGFVQRRCELLVMRWEG